MTCHDGWPCPATSACFCDVCVGCGRVRLPRFSPSWLEDLTSIESSFSRLAAIVTVFDMATGAVLQQNEKSVSYFGNMTSARQAGSDPLTCEAGEPSQTDVMRHLFHLDPNQLESILNGLRVR